MITLSGDALICVVIFLGKRENRLWETGIDVFPKTEGDVSDANYFEKIVVQTNNSPGGLPVYFKARKCHT